MRKESREGSQLKAKDKAFRRLIDGLAEGGIAVIVEGKRDRESLRRSGISNPIFLINQSPDAVAERVSKNASEAAILTDFDRKGEELLSRMTEALESHGVKPDSDVRRRLRWLFGVRHFEELDRKIEEFRKKREEIER